MDTKLNSRFTSDASHAERMIAVGHLQCDWLPLQIAYAETSLFESVILAPFDDQD